ncbi:MFS transporter [Nocardioides sp. Iso805N]|uniref:MFS transporter n=1 Tax=Nocardioides sp. Iso805N TaxID=1283287 RepID=UPI0003807802|nr:MFS transporter [Nocardioides sp. Iso805N]
MALESLWKRDLSRYPAPAHRWLLLIVTTLVTVALYYNYYVLGSAAPQIMGEFAWSLDKYIYIGAIATLVGAISAIAAGIGDKLGRSNLLLTATGVSLVFSFLMSHAHNGNVFIVLYCLLGLFEGFALVMSSTLMRDFSPRVGRGLAMGMWTVGPVGGSYISSKVAGHLLGHGHDWRDLYTIALVSGIVVWVIAIALLRDLAPEIRNEIIVEAEGSSLEVKAESDLQDASLPGVPGSTRFAGLADRLPPRLVIPALGVSLYLLMYFAAVSMFPLYLESMFKFEPSTANNMMSLFWLVNVVAALIFGGLSDWLRVRKPFLLAGAVMFFIACLLFTLRLGHPTSQTAMTWILVLMGAVVACGFAPWMAAISETAEELNPRRVAYGMAIFGSVQRLVIMVVSVVMPHVVGTEAGWRHWWIVSLIGIVLYIPTIPALCGGWRPGRARTRTVDADLTVASASRS